MTYTTHHDGTPRAVPRHAARIRRTPRAVRVIVGAAFVVAASACTIPFTPTVPPVSSAPSVWVCWSEPNGEHIGARVGSPAAATRPAGSVTIACPAG
jgi:hypothetical protein